MNHLLRTAILIVAAMTASALILAALFGMVWNVNLYGKGPADFVASSDIKAMLFYPSKRAVAQFPLITDTFIDAEAIAIFQNDDTMVFQKDFMRKDLVLELEENPLSLDPTFRILEKNQERETQWTYLPSSSLPQSTHLLSRVLKVVLTSRSDGVALLYDEDGITVEHPATITSVADAPMSTPTLQNTFFSIHFGNAHGSFLSFLNTLSSQDAVIIESLLRAAAKYFGEDVSFRYDLLPLAKKPSSLQLSSSGATLNFLLSGSMNEAVKLQSIVDRLHTTFESSLPKSTITKRFLDKRFSSIDIRHNPNMIERNQYTKNGWLIRSTHAKGSTKGLTSATRANHFLLSTTTSAITYAISNQQSTKEIRFGALSVDLSRIEILLPYLAISKKEITSKFGTGTLKITSHHNGKIRSTSIGSSKNPLQLLDLLR
jgi:hypothetical protein